jgi:hypothetical protein
MKSVIMQAMMIVTLLTLCPVANAQEKDVKTIVSKVNRDYLKGLVSINLSVRVYGSGTRGYEFPPGTDVASLVKDGFIKELPGKVNLYDRVLDSAELKLRQNGVRINARANSNDPTLTLVFDAKNECRATMSENATIDRLQTRTTVETWRFYFDYESFSTRRNVSTDEDAFKAFDDAVTRFCNDFLAANPKKQ